MNKLIKSIAVVALISTVALVSCKKDDIDAPVLTLLGDTLISIDLGATFLDPGFTAIDERDGDLATSVIKTGTVDNTKCGAYTITYTVNDEAGNASEVFRTVRVKSDKLIGTYSVNDVITNAVPSTNNGTYAYEIVVTQSSTKYNRILIANFGDAATSSIYADILGSVITIPSQSTNIKLNANTIVTISGSGTYDGSTFKLTNFTYNAGTSLGNGSATLVKK